MKPWVKQSLPQEHGSWAFVLEPLLIAGIWAGHWVSSLGFFLCFLAYRPLTVGGKDLLKKKRYERTVPMVASGISLLGIGLSLIVVARAYGLLVTLAGLGGVFAYMDQGEKRSISREVLGTLLAFPAAALAAPFGAAVFVLRPIAAVLSVRGFIGRMEDSDQSRWIAVGFGLALIVAAVVYLGIGWPTIAYAICGLRTLHLALTKDKEVAPVRIGMIEGVISLLVLAGWALARFAQ